MNTFNDIKELLQTLNRESKLISEMFTKRKSFDYKLSDALALVDYKEEQIDFLIQRSVIRENAGVLELDDLFLEFFEQVLDVNEDINLSFIDENIKNIKDEISYFLVETNENRKYNYLRKIKKILRKIGVITLKSVVDLRRNIENTFKNEANYNVKKIKLENLDKKRESVKSLIAQTLNLINNQELTFFNRALDEELNRIIIHLKSEFNECSHNLIEIEKQIIDYLNQIKIHGRFLEKLRKLKYLKDHFLIESQTNVKQVLSSKNPVVFEERITEPLHISIDFLREDDQAFELIKKVATKHKNRTLLKAELADSISEDFLDNTIEEEIVINFEELKNSFIATSDNLFNFILNYNFLKPIDFNERVTIFCQVISLYEEELDIKNHYEVTNGLEYAIVVAK
ncbi:hypothetical protein [Tenacibaculum maritimum]|uniref:Uncharacterized protein n=1 Tax=Tenacibaculum maritimum NCIMB 2154 TaxID=1349785 RepID=A0A2H1E8A1_9FLAO|nr:hypothetical protein [Tenacibaculum maritimum]SFZ81500.1 conserved protein of unknown function [Tenacibaculum maritimum NCIMB 2154]